MMAWVRVRTTGEKDCHIKGIVPESNSISLAKHIEQIRTCYPAPKQVFIFYVVQPMIMPVRRVVITDATDAVEGQFARSTVTLIGRFRSLQKGLAAYRAHAEML